MILLYIGNNPKRYEKFSDEMNISILTVRNSLEAINLLKSETDIDVIICDYKLPGNSGIFLYDRINKDPILYGIPFILVTEEFNKKIYNAAFNKGINDYFVSTSTQAEQIIKKAKSLYNSKVKYKDEVNKIVEQNVKYRIPLSKRVFDIVFASFTLLILSPMLLIMMIAIRIESKGKVYYIAKRVGRKTFDFYKLRSMRTGSDDLLNKLAKQKNQYNTNNVETTINTEKKCPRCSHLPFGEYCSHNLHEGIDKICDYWYNYQKKEIQNNNSTFIKILDDPRVTKVGKIIRNTSIDELPQLINVIKGDMSIVGNRPLPIYEAELLTQDAMSKRFLAPAGITGLWQVELRGKEGDMSQEERIQLDNKYADYFKDNNYSFWYDIKIILRTIPALLQRSAV